MSRRLTATLIDGLTAQNVAGTLSSADLANLNYLGVYVEFDHTSAAGQVLIETAYDASYAGTWHILSTINWSAIDKAHYASIIGSLGAVRARIASAVTSGTVSVKVVGNLG